MSKFTPSQYQQDIFDWVNETQSGNLVVEALAGSGKTTTGIEIFQLLSSEIDAIFVAFNKHIANELSRRLPAPASARTYHSLGLGILRSNFGRVDVDNKKVDKILERFMPRKHNYWKFHPIRKLTGLVKANLSPTNHNSLKNLASYYGIDLNNGLDPYEIFDAVRRVVKESAKWTSSVDFNDMCWLPIHLDLPARQYDFLFVDELQDTNTVQTELVMKSIKPEGRIIAVGDRRQCVIEGTEIMCYNKRMLVQDAFDGNKVVSAFGNGRTSTATVLKTYKRKVKEKRVVTIKTASGKKLTTTPEHLYFADFINGQSGNKYYVYLMKKGNWYRVGMAGWYRNKEGGIIPGFKGRGNQEQADAMWILEICDSQVEARFWEQYYSINYGIPTWLFRVTGRGYKLVYDEVWIEKLFSSMNTEVRAGQLLRDKDYQFTRPHYAPKCMSKRRRRNFSITLCGDQRKNWLPSHCFAVSGSDSEDEKTVKKLGLKTRPSKNKKGWRFAGVRANLVEIYNLAAKLDTSLGINIIEKANFGGKDTQSLRFMPASQVLPGMFVYIQDKNGKIILEEVVSQEKSLYSGYVYDLDIERVHNYIAGGIVVHNSIYSFAGAGAEAIPDFINRTNADTLPLSITYRNPKNVVDLVTQTFPEIPLEFPDWAIDGEVQNIDEKMASNEYGEGDMVLCRVNAPLVRPCFALIREGKKATIRGRDIGKNLSNLIKKMKADNMHTLMTKLRDYRLRETSKLIDSDKFGQAALLDDKVDTIIAIADGCKDVIDVTNKIASTFSDEVEGVIFSSIHKAKGLEAKNIFLLRPDLLPHPMAKQPWEQQQERNLSYVAMTRTLEKLSFVV